MTRLKILIKLLVFNATILFSFETTASLLSEYSCSLNPPKQNYYSKFIPKKVVLSVNEVTNKFTVVQPKGLVISQKSSTKYFKQKNRAFNIVTFIVNDDGQTLVTINYARIYDNGGLYYEFRIPERNISFNVGGSCKVVKPKETVETQANCKTNPWKCSNIELCQLASLQITSSHKKWTSIPFYQKHIFEAKHRGLTCGIQEILVLKNVDVNDECIAGNIGECSHEELCQLATKKEGSLRIWKDEYLFIDYVAQAKSLGLNCGIAKTPKITSPSYVAPKTLKKTTPSYVAPKKVKKTTTKVIVKDEKTNPAPSLQEADVKNKPLINPLNLRKYGPFYFTPLEPNTIYMIGEINQGTEQALRLAIRSHDIKNIVLFSNGGLIFDGLETANLIYDNKLRTIIPLDATCASSCSFMFFAGNERNAFGKLGVHQFFTEDSNKNIQIGIAQEQTQGLVSEIIQTLESFDVPASVFSRMFAHKDMYYFSEMEKSEFSDLNPADRKELDLIQDIFWLLAMELTDEPMDEAIKKLSDPKKVKLIQIELNRLGCSFVKPDGIWGPNTEEAVRKIMKNRYEGMDYFVMYRALNQTREGACY